MRLMKMFGFAAIVTAAAAALVGVSSASANPKAIVFCRVAVLEPKCPEPLPNPTTITLHANGPKLLSSVGTVECEKSLWEITLLNELSELVTGHVLAFSWEGNCHLGGTACTVTIPTLGLLSYTHGTFALKAFASLTGGTKMTFKCGSFINCTYGGEPQLEGSSTETGETTFVANKATLAEGKGFLCPATAEWDATFAVLGTVYLES